MADKEATVYVVDLGKSMGRTLGGRDQSDLDWAMVYLWDKITTIIALDRKTTLQGIIGLKTDDTSNTMSEEEGFENISVLQDLTAMSLDNVRRLEQSLKPSSTNKGDAISAIVIAIELITKTCKKLKYRKRIVLVTNGSGAMDADDIGDISQKLNEDEIELVVLGVDFDDEEYGFKEKNKSESKTENEGILKRLTVSCNQGVFGTLAEAIGELGQPRLKTTRQVASFKDELLLGSRELQTEMSIPVERYPRTMIRKPATASSFVQRDMASGQSSSTLAPDADGDVVMQGGSDLAAVKNTRQYEVLDETALNGKRHVDFESLVKGYAYGNTAVHVSESDGALTKFDEPQSLQVIGFVPTDNYPHYMGMTKTNVLVARRGDTESSMAMSALVNALAELESFAIARLVPKINKAPVLLLLAPLIDPEYECLVDVELPFAEDMRSYKFPPLDKVITVSGKVVKEHRNLPSGKLQQAVDDYVDQMDLMTAERDEEDNPSEFLKIGDAFSPLLHRIDQGIRFRAVHPTEPIPDTYDVLLKYSKPPADLLIKASPAIKSVADVADLKAIEPKKSGHFKKRKEDTTISGKNVLDILYKDGAGQNVDPKNPIPTFKRMLDNPDETYTLEKAVGELGSVIEEQVRTGFGNSAHEVTIAEMRVMRTEMNDFEAPDLWNKWVKNFKKLLHQGKLGGDRSELWYDMREASLGLLVGEHSEVKEEEAKQLWKRDV